MENFELLYSLFNQYLFVEAKNNIANIKCYFDTNPGTSGNPLVTHMLEAIRDYDLSAIDVPLFQSILMKSGKTPVESEKILSLVRQWKGYSKEQMIPAKKNLECICARMELIKLGNQYGQDPVEYIKAVKNLNFKTADLDVFSTTTFGQIDINSITADANTGYITSAYNWINDTFAPLNGYEKGQLVIICAAPGTGKSLFMMSEALFMAMRGSKVLYVGLGDNNMKDFVTRFGSIYLEKPFFEVKGNLPEVYNQLRPLLQDNLEISINPAGKVSAEDIVEYVKTRPEFEVVMVDYDSNLKGVGESDNMYNSFGAAYEKLTELTLEGKLVFVGSQTKVSSWSNEVINLTDVGESSRKQHSADMIIGIGKAINCPNHVHCFNISKNRRGAVDEKAYTIRLNNGKFYTICRELYNELKQETGKVNYSPEAIRQMNDQLEAQKMAVSGGIASQMRSFQQPSAPNIIPQRAVVGANPFGR